MERSDSADNPVNFIQKIKTRTFGPFFEPGFASKVRNTTGFKPVVVYFLPNTMKKGVE
jgi:hypothetical protein